jgi:predicted nucleic acid-binding protein
MIARHYGTALQILNRKISDAASENIDAGYVPAVQLRQIIYAGSLICIDKNVRRPANLFEDLKLSGIIYMTSCARRKLHKRYRDSIRV